MHAPVKSMRLVYVSALAPGVDYRVVTDVFRTARRENVADGIGGFIVFDGNRFCGSLHGPAAAVTRLREAICNDRRLVDFRVLLEDEPCAGAPVPENWLSGYVDAAMIDRIDRLDGAEVARLATELDQLTRSADLDDWTHIEESAAARC